MILRPTSHTLPYLDFTTWNTKLKYINESHIHFIDRTWSLLWIQRRRGSPKPPASWIWGLKTLLCRSKDVKAQWALPLYLLTYPSLRSSPLLWYRTISPYPHSYPCSGAYHDIESIIQQSRIVVVKSDTSSERFEVISVSLSDEATWRFVCGYCQFYNILRVFHIMALHSAHHMSLSILNCPIYFENSG